MSWTEFMDMHSGGGLKEDWQYIYIEASQKEAEVIFYNRFGHNPYRVSCTCCGSDYSMDEDESLEQATAFQRGCRYAYFRDGIEISEDAGFIRGKGIVNDVIGKWIEESDKKYGYRSYQTLEEYLLSGECYVIRQSDISPKEKIGTLPQQGYIWVD